MRRVVLESAVLGRVVGRGDDDAVGPRPAVRAVPPEDGVGDDRRRGVAVRRVDPYLHAVRREHLEGGPERGLGEGVGVLAEEEGARCAVGRAVLADRLRRGEDVGLVEAGPERRAAVPGGPEGDPLGPVGGVRPRGVVGGEKAGDVDEVGGLGRLAGARMRHENPP